MKLGVSIGIEVFATLTERRGDKVIRVFNSHNVITDAGFDFLLSTDLSSALQYLALISKPGDTTIDAVPATDKYVQGVHPYACGAGMLGADGTTQNSWIEGYSNNLTLDTNGVAGDYSYTDFTRRWTIQPVDVDFSTRGTTVPGTLVSAGGSNTAVGNDAVGNGGKTAGITGFVIGQAGWRNLSFYINQCYLATDPGPPVGEPSPHWVHVQQLYWSHGLFKDGGGSPTAVDLTGLSTFDFDYTIRLHVPVTPVEQTFTLFGTLYTATTRAHAVQDAGWNPRYVTTFQIGATQATAWEDDSVPALNAYKGNGGLGSAAVSTSTIAPQTGHFRDVTHVWEPAIANFATGIGAITHGVKLGGGTPLFITSFSPKLPKNSNRRLFLTGRYSWARVGGD